MINTKNIFYIYSYVNGRQDRNVGFVKFKKRENGYRMNLTIRVPVEYVAEQMHICLYKWDSGRMVGYQLGTVNPFSERCRFNTNIETVKLSEYGLFMEDIAGIYIFGKEQQNYLFSAKIKQEEDYSNIILDENECIQCVC